MVARQLADPEQDRGAPSELVSPGEHPAGGESVVYVLLMESEPGVGPGGWYATECFSGCSGRGA